VHTDAHDFLKANNSTHDKIVFMRQFYTRGDKKKRPTDRDVEVFDAMPEGLLEEIITKIESKVSPSDTWNKWKTNYAKMPKPPTSHCPQPTKK